MFAFPISFDDPWVLDLTTDRKLYEPGETVHGWARLRDKRSLRPLAGERIQFTAAGTGTEKRTVKVAASGVASISATIPKEAQEGHYALTAQIGQREVHYGFRIGTRTYERLFAEIKVTPETAQPHQPIQVVVKVTTASGALVRNAAVTVKVDEEMATGTTDKNGLATLAMQAPAYMTHATGSVPIQVTVSHPAHGSALARSALRLAVPLTLAVEVVPANGALVPEIESRLYVHLSEGSGKPPAVGTPVEVRGAAVRKGFQRGVTDVHGIVSIPTRLPRGAATGDGSSAVTTVVVHVEGQAPRTASITVQVARETEVVPTVSSPVASPGESLTIVLARRASATRVPIIVEFLSKTGPLDARVVAAGSDRVVMKAPSDRLGVIQVRARPLHQRGVVEGAGGIDAFVVRPLRPSFPTLSADKPVYPVKSSARLTLKTTPGASQSWAAVLVRDLAAHGGEVPFQLHFLRKAFDRAILDPNSKAADTLLRTALAAYAYQEDAPEAAATLLDALGTPHESNSGLESSTERGVLRDPYPLSDELSRRGVGRVMNRLEQLLAQALDEGRLADVTVASVRARRFRSDVFSQFDELPITLGDGALALAMLTASDPSFTYDNVGRRIARFRLMRLLVALSAYLDPGDDASPRQRAAAREPSDRWLPRMVERGLIKAEDLADPWGGSFTLRRTAKPRLAIAVEAANLELVSPGPDGKLGTRDDISDPFARAVPAGTPYAVASGEDNPEHGDVSVLPGLPQPAARHPQPLAHPVLDGGHILILGFEGVLRRDLSMRVKEVVMQVGLVFLLVLFAAIIWLDVAKASS